MEKKTPTVFCIILTWNDKENVLEAIGSVLDTRYPDFRVVVVDNASTDGTQAAIRKAYPEAVHLIENSENLKFSGGNNAGIRYAMDHGADFIILLNNDIAVDSGMVKALVDAAVENDAGMAGPMMYYYPPKGEGAEVIWYAGGKISYWQGRISHRGIRETDRGQYAGASETDYISGCVLLVRRDVVEKVGLLDPSYIYGEDTDWCERAKRAGFRVLFVPEARMWHKVSVSSGGGLTPHKVYYRIRSSIRFFRAYASWYHWLTIPFFVVMGGLAFIAASALRGDFRDIRSFITGIFVPKRLQPK